MLGEGRAGLPLLLLALKRVLILQQLASEELDSCTRGNEWARRPEVRLCNEHARLNTLWPVVGSPVHGLSWHPAHLCVLEGIGGPSTNGEKGLLTPVGLERSYCSQ